MKKGIEQSKNEAATLEMARQAFNRVKEMDMSPEEKVEIMKMIDQAKEAESSGNKAKALRLYNELLKKLKEIKKSETNFLEFVSAEGKEVKIEMAKQLKYWGEFYQEQGIDWIEMPEKITLTAEDREELTKGAKALCPDGNFEKLKLLIIPAGLADSGEKYVKLNEKMSQGYEDTWQKGNFKADGSFEGLKNKSDKLRIILVKDVRNLEDDEVYKSTLDKSADDLDAAGGIFEQTGLRGIEIQPARARK